MTPLSMVLNSMLVTIKLTFQAAYGYLTSSSVKTTAGAAVDKDANAEVAILRLKR